MAPLAKVFGGIATVLVTLMLIGFVLPGTWSAEASIQIEAAPTEVFPFLNDLSRWGYVDQLGRYRIGIE